MPIMLKLFLIFGATLALSLIRYFLKPSIVNGVPVGMIEYWFFGEGVIHILFLVLFAAGSILLGFRISFARLIIVCGLAMGALFYSLNDVEYSNGISLITDRTGFEILIAAILNIFIITIISCYLFFNSSLSAYR